MDKKEEGEEEKKILPRIAVTSGNPLLMDTSEDFNNTIGGEHGIRQLSVVEEAHSTTERTQLKD